MRSLTEITYAVRRNEPATLDEMRYAIVANDVLLAQLHIAWNEHQLADFFAAAESCPKAYVGWDNDPENPEAVEWHRQNINIMPILDAARHRLAAETGIVNGDTRYSFLPSGGILEETIRCHGGYSPDHMKGGNTE